MTEAVKGKKTGNTEQELHKALLLVEEDPHVQESLRTLLIKCGFDVKTEASLSGSIKKLKQQEFNAVIIDCALPDVAGSPAIKALSEITTSTPIIVIGGDDELEKSAIAAGASCFIQKPINPPELLKSLINRV